MLLDANKSVRVNIYGYQCPYCQTKFKTSRAPNYEDGETIENSWCPDCFKVVPLNLSTYIGSEDKMAPTLINTDQPKLISRIFNHDQTKLLGVVKNIEQTDDEIIVTVSIKKAKE